LPQTQTKKGQPQRRFTFSWSLRMHTEICLKGGFVFDSLCRIVLHGENPENLGERLSFFGTIRHTGALRQIRLRRDRFALHRA
jgi:hypothetical protein